MKSVLLVNLDHGKISLNSKVPEALGLLKLSTWYKKNGYHVRFQSCKKFFKDEDPEIICFSPTFVFNIKRDFGYIFAFIKKYAKAKIRIGGVTPTLKPELFKKYFPEAEIVTGIQNEFEFEKPDYEIAGKDYSYGFTSRGCTRKCEWCAVPKNEGRLQKNENGKWINALNENHSLYCCMDNNILACGHKWVEHVFAECAKRNMKIDFNQGLDCRIFIKKDGRYADMFKEYEKNISVLRFAWDSREQDDTAKRCLEMVQQKNIKCIKRWYMLYGWDDTPEEIWKRMKLMTEHGCDVKPMRYKDLENGESKKGWSKNFLTYLSMIGPTGLVVPSDFKIGKYGKNEKEFIGCLEIGKSSSDIRKMINSTTIKKQHRETLFRTLKNHAESSR